MKIELIDHSGDDLRVVNAARVSFDKESDWKTTWCGSDCPCGDVTGKWVEPDPRCRELFDQDKKLIAFLAREKHFTPFTHCSVTLRETVPIFVARQRFKHVVGFTYNEVSRRYVDASPEFYSPDVWRKRAENKKQGSGEDIDEDLAWDVKANYEFAVDTCLSVYEILIESGVAPEQARMVLPQSTYTSYYVSGTLAAFARAYNLRSEETAQKEIQLLAAMWKEIIEPLFPVSWKALTT